MSLNQKKETKSIFEPYYVTSTFVYFLKPFFVFVFCVSRHKTEDVVSAAFRDDLYSGYCRTLLFSGYCRTLLFYMTC